MKTWKELGFSGMQYRVSYNFYINPTNWIRHIY